MAFIRSKNKYYMIPAIVVFGGIRSITSPLIESRGNRYIETRVRVTIHSMVN